MEIQQDQMAVHDKPWKTTRRARKLMAEKKVVIILAPGPRDGEVWCPDGKGEIAGPKFE